MLGRLLVAFNGGREWRHRPGSAIAFGIDDPRWSQAPRDTYVEVSLVSGGRCDWLMLGAPDDPEADLTIVLWQLGRHARRRTNTIAGEMAEIHRLSRLDYELDDAFHALETRLGAFRAQSLTIACDGVRKLGLAFVSRFGAAPVLLKGWLCAPPGEQPSPQELAALLDRIALTGPLGDREARDWMAAGLARPPHALARTLNPRPLTHGVL